MPELTKNDMRDRSLNPEWLAIKGGRVRLAIHADCSWCATQIMDEHMPGATLYGDVTEAPKVLFRCIFEYKLEEYKRQFQNEI